jgi:hypothetical protein
MMYGVCLRRILKGRACAWMAARLWGPLHLQNILRQHHFVDRLMRKAVRLAVV